MTYLPTETKFHLKNYWMQIFVRNDKKNHNFFKEDLERCNTHLIKCQLIELIIDETWVSVKLGE